MTQLGTKKSRNGCACCKRRKVKCDEEVPCSNCARRNEECSLLFSPSPALSPDSLQLPPNQNTSDWLQDLELMHNYSSNTDELFFYRRADLTALWRHNVPQMAVEHPHVMHALLAYSALHLASVRPAQATKYLRICDKHQAVAIAQFREMLPNIDQSNADAMFALSAIFSGSTIARMTVLSSTDPQGPRCVTVDELVELFILTRGVRDVTGQGLEWIRAGPFASTMHGFGTPENARIPKAATRRLVELGDLFVLACDTSASYELCIEATNFLSEIYATIATHMANFSMHDATKTETGMIMRYPTMLQPDFVRLVQARHPAALVLVAHFAILWGLVSRIWHVQDLGMRVLRGIQVDLRKEWQPWLDWPKTQLETGVPVFAGEMEFYDGTRKILPFYPLQGGNSPEWLEMQRNRRKQIAS